MGPLGVGGADVVIDRRFETLDLPGAEAASTSSLILPSLFHKLSAEFSVDRTARSRINDLRKAAIDPLSGRQLIRVARREVGKQFAYLGLPLELTEGVVTDLTPCGGEDLDLTAFESDPLRDDTPGKAVERAVEQQRRGLWSVRFGLLYRAGPRAIPLDRAHSITVLVRGSQLETQWQGVPVRDRLPAAVDLFPNVTPERAARVARREFLRAVGTDSGLTEGDIASGVPREELWFGAPGAGRLAWAVDVAVKPEAEGTAPAVDPITYIVEARIPGGQPTPKVFRGVPSSAPGLTSSAPRPAPSPRPLLN
jgi:hypothetical protein